MKKVLIATGAVAVVFICWATISQGKQANPVRTIMKTKLKHAQMVLEGLTQENFVKIQESAKSMSALSRAAEWNVHKSPEYVRFSREFRQITTDMEKHAKNKNLDACTLDYIQMTLTCVACHKHVRNIVVAQGLEVPSMPDIFAIKSPAQQH